MKTEKLANRLFYVRYKQRLLEAISEVDVLDDQGNIIISKDLKVRHKDSGFEYTVDDVVDDAGEISVVLREPSEPRFEPQGEESLLGAPPGESLELNEEDGLDEEEEVVFVIDQEEFEKEYEVK